MTYVITNLILRSFNLLKVVTLKFLRIIVHATEKKLLNNHKSIDVLS